MAARRCSTCGVNYRLSVHSCPDCGGELWHSNTSTPDADVTASRDDEVAGVFKANEKVDEYRFERFIVLGLDVERAEQAAIERATHGDGGYRVDLHAFEDLVRPKRPGRGACAPEIAFEILF